MTLPGWASWCQTDEWLQNGAGGLASLVGLAGWLHFDVIGGDETTSAAGTTRAADGSGVASTGSVEKDKSAEPGPSETSASEDETQGDSETPDEDTKATDDADDESE